MKTAKRKDVRRRAGRNGLRFVRLSRGQAGVLESMALALYEEDPSPQGMSRRKIRRTIAELTAHPEKGSITLIRAGREVVGYFIVIHFWSNEYGGHIAFIDELYIVPSWRSRGIGAECLKQIAATPGMNFKGMQLETTHRNVRARRFYARHGFVSARNRFLFCSLRRTARRRCSKTPIAAI